MQGSWKYSLWILGKLAHETKNGQEYAFVYPYLIPYGPESSGHQPARHKLLAQMYSLCISPMKRKSTDIAVLKYPITDLNTEIENCKCTDVGVCVIECNVLETLEWKNN